MKKTTASTMIALPATALLTLSACASDEVDHNDIGQSLADEFMAGVDANDTELATGASCPDFQGPATQLITATQDQMDIESVSVNEHGDAVTNDGDDDAFDYPVEITTAFNDDADDVVELLTFNIENVEGEWCIANLS